MSRIAKRAWQSLVNLVGSRGEQGAMCADIRANNANRPPVRNDDSAPHGEEWSQTEPEYGSARLSEELSLDVSAVRVARILLVVAVALVVLSLVVGLVGLFDGPFVRLLYVGADLSLPSWYSALVLVLASILLATIAFAVKASESPRYARRWAILAAIFAYLSCDETLRLHERMADTVLQPALEALGFIPGGILYYPWVIVYAPLVVVFALAYFGFWRALPTRTRKLFLAAGVVFVGGAMGVELFNAYNDEASGRDLLVFVGTHVEESLEMVGVVAFVYALMTYLSSRLGVEELRLRLASRPEG